MSNEQISRIKQGKEEAIQGWARAMNYLPKHRDMKLVSSYEAHIAKMDKMLEEACV